MGVLPSSSAVLSHSDGVSSTINVAPMLAVAQEATHPKAGIEELDKQPERIVWFPPPLPGCPHRSYPGCKLYGTHTPESKHNGSTKESTVDWNEMHRQEKAQILQVESTAAKDKSGTLFPASVSHVQVSKRSDDDSGIVIDNKVKQTIMNASDKDLAELAASFSNPEDFPEWYKKLPEGQKGMFEQTTQKKGGKGGMEGKTGNKMGDGKKGDDRKHGNGDEAAKNSSSMLTVCTMLKISMMAVFFMAMW